MKTQVIYNPDFNNRYYDDEDSYAPSYAPNLYPDDDDYYDGNDDYGDEEEEEYDDYNEPSRYELLQEKIRRRKRRLFLTKIMILVGIASGMAFFLIYFHVFYYKVNGSTFYTDEEIADQVMQGVLGDNSVVLSLRYQDSSVTDIPFIDKVDVKITSHDTIEITVYEKQIAGCVNYLGQYFYFTEDGRVCDTSDTQLDGVPEIYGLSFSYIALNEKIPVEDESVFENILKLTQLLDKYELSADKIYLDQNGNMSVYFDNVRVTLGDDTYLDEKLSNLAQILPYLEGKNGTLKLADFTPQTKYVTFVDYDATTKESTTSIDATTGETTTTTDATTPTDAATSTDTTTTTDTTTAAATTDGTSSAPSADATATTTTDTNGTTTTDTTTTTTTDTTAAATGTDTTTAADTTGTTTTTTDTTTAAADSAAAASSTTTTDTITTTTDTTTMTAGTDAGTAAAETSAVVTDQTTAAQ